MVECFTVLQQSWLSATEWIINYKLSSTVITVPPSTGLAQKLQRNLFEEILENFTSAQCITCSDLSITYELISVLSALLFHFIFPCCVSVPVTTGWLNSKSFLSLTVCILLSLSFKSLGSDPLFAVTFTQAELGLALRGAGLKGSLCLGEEKCSHLAARWPGSVDGGWQGGCLDCCLALQKPTSPALIECANEPTLPSLCFKTPEVVRIWQYFWAAMG